MRKFQTKNSTKKFLCTADATGDGKISNLVCQPIQENHTVQNSRRDRDAETIITLQEDNVNKDIPRQFNFNYGVTYYIWPFMFYSSSKKNLFPDAQTGIPTRYGTIKGIEEKLDYFEDLGVKNLMIGPITKCWEGGMNFYNINRYQTIDWRTTQPQLGTLDNVKSLCKKAHHKGLKVLQDFTFNHCSYQHQFYLKALGFTSNSKEREKYKKWFIFESFTPDGSVNNDPFNPNGPYASYVKNLLIEKYGVPEALFNTNSNGNLIPSYYLADPNGYAWGEIPAYFMQLTDDPNQANSIKSNLVPLGSDLSGKWVMVFSFTINLIQLNWIDYPKDMYDYFVDTMKLWLNLGIDGFRWDVVQNFYRFNYSGHNESFVQKITKELIRFKPTFIAFAEGCYQGGFFGPYTLGVQQNLFGALVRGGASGSVTFPNVNNQNLIKVLIEQYKIYYNKTVSLTLLGNHDMGRLLSIYQYQPPDYNPYTDLSVQERELRNVSYYTLLLCMPGSPMVYYGEELAEIGSTYAQCRDYFKWDQSSYNNGICDTYNVDETYPQQTRGDGLINPGDPNDTTTPLNFPITRGLDIQRSDSNSSWNQIRKLIHLRNKNSILQKGELLELDSNIASLINLNVINASPDALLFARYYNDAYVFVIINQDPNDTGNVSTITFDSNYNNNVLYVSFMASIAFTNGLIITEAQTYPTTPQNEVQLGPWESLIISYNNNGFADF